VVGDFRFICRHLLGVPHEVVQVWEVVIQVDSFIVVSSLGPAGQLRALQRIGRKRGRPYSYSITGVVKDTIKLERALGGAQTFAYHKIGHLIMNMLALVACQLVRN